MLALKWPSEIYDIRGVFDGSVIKNGWEGYPTTIYTSTFTGPLGATSDPPEMDGAEMQSIAFTKDDGRSWTKLSFGSRGNPVICMYLPLLHLKLCDLCDWYISLTKDEWPLKNLTGFRDPYAFISPILSSLFSNATNANGDIFLTISSGVRTSADPSGGPRLLLYRQTKPGDVLGWTYLGPLVSLPALSSFSEWSGNFGINFETACVVRLDEKGDATNNIDARAINFIGFGTEEGRNGSHEDHWPLCKHGPIFFILCLVINDDYIDKISVQGPRRLTKP